MSCITVSSVECQALTHFTRYVIRDTVLKILLNINVFGLSLQILCATLLTLCTVQKDIIINVHTYLCEVPFVSAEL